MSLSRFGGERTESNLGEIAGVDLNIIGLRGTGSKHIEVAKRAMRGIDVKTLKAEERMQAKGI